MALDEADMHRLGLNFLYQMTPVIIVSVLYGIYIAVLVLATQAIAERGLKNSVNATILAILYVVFLFTSALWGIGLVHILSLNHVMLLAPNGLSGDALFNRYYVLLARETRIMDILFHCQMILGDILVIWRAAAIWHDRRAFVLIPFFWWALMIVSMLINASFCPYGLSSTDYTNFCHTMDILVPVTSILVNVSVMALTFAKAWHLRAGLRGTLRLRRKRSKLLTLFTLFIESGTLYVIMLTAEVVAASFVPDSLETPAEFIDYLFGASSVQIVGIYPTLMIVVLRQSIWN
ncbi:hypothetical protein K488DRAFT_38072, partial [Vararia minispora EC-137]